MISMATNSPPVLLARQGNGDRLKQRLLASSMTQHGLMGDRSRTLVWAFIIKSQGLRKYATSTTVDTMNGPSDMRLSYEKLL